MIFLAAVPWIIGGAGALALGGATGFTLSKGAEKTGEALKWAVLGGVSLAAIAATVYVVRKT